MVKVEFQFSNVHCKMCQVGFACKRQNANDRLAQVFPCLRAFFSNKLLDPTTEWEKEPPSSPMPKPILDRASFVNALAAKSLQTRQSRGRRWP
jgi:hypothetical protein